MSCSQSLNQNTRISPKWLQGLESRWCHLPKNGGINVKVGGRGTEKGTQEDKLRAQVLGSRPESSSAHKGMAGAGGGAAGRSDEGFLGSAHIQGAPPQVSGAPRSCSWHRSPEWQGSHDKLRCWRQQRPRFKFSTCHVQPWASGSSPVNWERPPPSAVERSKSGNTQSRLPFPL